MTFPHTLPGERSSYCTFTPNIHAATPHLHTSNSSFSLPLAPCTLPPPLLAPTHRRVPGVEAVDQDQARLLFRASTYDARPDDCHIRPLHAASRLSREPQPCATRSMCIISTYMYVTIYEVPYMYKCPTQHVPCEYVHYHDSLISSPTLNLIPIPSPYSTIKPHSHLHAHPVTCRCTTSTCYTGSLEAR